MKSNVERLSDMLDHRELSGITSNIKPHGINNNIRKLSNGEYEYVSGGNDCTSECIDPDDPCGFC